MSRGKAISDGDTARVALAAQDSARVSPLVYLYHNFEVLAVTKNRLTG
jgi:hypothetical protein